MNNNCCRLRCLLTPDRVMKIFVAYGPKIEVFDNSMEGEPDHGWLMTKPNEGYPCDKLTPTGCGLGDRPTRCRDFPTSEASLRLIDTCGFKFVDGKRQGECTGCK